MEPVAVLVGSEGWPSKMIIGSELLSFVEHGVMLFEAMGLVLGAPG